MSRHLHLVDSASDEPSYVVARTVHVRPGTPYVVAVCSDEAVAETLALAGHDTHGAGEMGRRAELARALRAWEEGDHRLHRSERAAGAAFARSVAGETDGRSRHPSRLARMFPPRAVERP